MAVDPSILDDIARRRSRSKAKKETGNGVDLSDDALALAFAEQHQHLRYVELRGRWLRFDGKVWREDSTGHTFADVRTMLRTHPADPEKRKRLRSAAKVAAVERLARCDRRLAATIDQWETDDWLLNTHGEMVDLRTGKTRPHDPLAYCQKITAVAPGGPCRRWMQFLDECTGGDRHLADFLKRVVGYSLTGSTREHALFFLYGTGANGKGTFLNTLTNFLGNYAAVSSMETFTESFSDRHPADLAALQGARLVTAQETEEGRRWAESRVKALTGGDPITARFMRQDYFTFQPKFKLLIAGNHKPRLRNVDEAIRRRLHLIPFTVTIPPEKREKDLADKLKAEWPGILQWAIDGCRGYLAEGLSPPPSVRAATDEYFSGQDLFSLWLEDHCERGPALWEPNSRLFASFKRYCENASTRPPVPNDFAERMQSAGFERGNSRAKGGRYWDGLALLSAFDDSPGWAGG